ncbi:MAG: hypothetical protein JRE45_12185 [Deltaproteobacteria bacterium]|nr:hypothetical protein [Deltaproteobacteria bacterium]
MNSHRHLWIGTVVSLGITALVLWPAFGDPGEDSFPLSTYPMFSHGKHNPDLVLTQALAVFPNGDRKPLPPKLATGNEEVIQAMRMIIDETYGGEERAKSFCRDIADRIHRASAPRWKEAIAVEIARSHFDTVAYFEKEPKPLNRRTLQRCLVKR